MDKHEKLRELAAKATPGPWHASGMGKVHTADHLLIFDLVCDLIFDLVCDPEGTAEDDQMACGTDADCEYAAAACNAVPDLLDENERLRKALESLISKLDEIDQHPSFKSLFVLAFTHGAEYDGPSWSDAYAKAREALERK